MLVLGGPVASLLAFRALALGGQPATAPWLRLPMQLAFIALTGWAGLR